MEYADAGDLSMVVKRQRELKQYLPESDILSWFVQIALGLQYIHKKNILHRDLKTQNIFVTSKKLVKIGDFGISKWLSHTLDLATTAIGTPHYLSPEICRRQPYSHKSDMWSLGNIDIKYSIPLRQKNPIRLRSVRVVLLAVGFPCSRLCLLGCIDRQVSPYFCKNVKTNMQGDRATLAEALFPEDDRPGASAASPCT